MIKLPAGLEGVSVGGARILGERTSGYTFAPSHRLLSKSFGIGPGAGLLKFVSASSESTVAVMEWSPGFVDIEFFNPDGTVVGMFHVGMVPSRDMEVSTSTKPKVLTLEQVHAACFWEEVLVRRLESVWEDPSPVAPDGLQLRLSRAGRGHYFVAREWCTTTLVGFKNATPPTSTEAGSIPMEDLLCPLECDVVDIIRRQQHRCSGDIRLLAQFLAKMVPDGRVVTTPLDCGVPTREKELNKLRHVLEVLPYSTEQLRTVFTEFIT